MIHKFGATFASLILLVILQGMSQSATAAITITPATLPAWTLNKSGYLQTLAGSGGTAPYTFTVTVGAVPTGLTLSAAGVLSGTPTAATTFNFTVKATDSLAASGTVAYSVTINPAVTIAPASLPSWTLNKSGYSQTITSANGTGAKTLSVSTGAIPTGMTFTAGTGVLSGTPTATGPFSFTITATDTVGATGAQAYTVTINPAVTVTPASLPSWTLNKSGYSQTITNANGTGAKTLSVSTGAIPTGMTFTAGTGVLSGTPTAAGPFSFTITATDTVGATGAQAYTVTINPAVTVTQASLPNWTLNQGGYLQTITSANGTGAKTLSVSTGAIPTGMTFTAGTGVLTGTPTASGTFNFTITATDTVGATGAQAYTVIINPAVTVTPSTLANWTINISGYLQTITNTGGTGAASFAVTSGALPGGLTLAAGGLLSGTPTAAGTFNFTVTATDTSGATGARAYAVIINPVVSITTATLPAWTSNKTYLQTIATTGGTGAASFAVTTGALPGGLTMTSAGLLSGMPTATGTFGFTITATDTVGSTSAQAYTVTINPAVTVTPASLPNWTLNQSGYLQTITSANGTGARMLSISTGAIPTGMTFTAGTGILTGIPTAAGTFNFMIMATDTVGATGAQAYTVIINPVVAVATGTLPNWTLNRAYSQTIATTGGTGAATFAVTTGALPGGLTMTSAGVLSGTPTATGTFSFTITATDTVGSIAARAYTVVINPAVTVAAASLPAWTLSKSGYSQTIISANGTGARTLSVSTGAIPAGMTLGAGTGLLSGTPAAAGTFNFTITATDTVGATGVQAYTLIINPAVTIAPTTLPNWTLFIPGYSQTFSTTGGTGAVTLALTSGALPGGLTMTNAGLLSGLPNVSGTFNFTIKGTDTVGATGAQAYTVVINPTVSMATTTLPNWTLNTPGYSKIVAAAGGTGAATFAVTSGALPAGLTLTSAGLISGTPGALGTFGVTLTATDTLGATGAQAYWVTINPAVLIATVTLSNWTVNKSGYLQTLAVTGGTGVASFAVTTGALPGGLTLSSHGVLSGTPKAVGTFNFTITATDVAGSTSSQASTVIINPAVTVTPPGLPNWTAGKSGYLQTITSANGTGARRLTVSIGAVPGGLTLTPEGVLSGTPTTPGSFAFTITATDTVGATGAQACTVIINPPVSVAPATLPNLTFKFSGYSQTVFANGGTGVSTLAVTAGSLPTGLTLSSGGLLSGTPSVIGTFNFVITATDTLGASGSQAYTVMVNPATPTVVAPTYAAIMGASATVGGSVLTDGGDPISVVGVVLAPSGVNGNPQIDGTGVINVSGSAVMGSFTLRATSLNPSTDYTFAAYATNGQGTSYSSVGNFTTLSNNAALAGLLLSAAPLSPAFGSSTASYTATVSNLTTSIIVIPTVAQAQAAVQINGVASGGASAPIPLSVGINTITVTVASQDGTATRTYTVAVTRQTAFISVYQPAGTALINGASITDFGKAGVGKMVSRTFTVKNISSTVLSNFVLGFYDANPWDFSVTTAPAASLAIGASTMFAITFNPDALGARSATLQIDATGEMQNSFSIALTGAGVGLPAITKSPVSQLVAAGQPAAFTVEADGDTLSYKWLGNNAPVPGATGVACSLASAALASAGVYTAVVTNVAGSVTSQPANLGVVSVVAASVSVVNGQILTLTASAAGPGLAYQWLKDGAVMTDGTNPANSLGSLSGTAASKLSITQAAPADAGTYTCLVTMLDPQNPGTPLSLSSGVFTVNVTSKPVIDVFAPGPWVVSGPVSDVVTAQNSPTSFTLTGQPAGVTIDARGHFQGGPTLALTVQTSYHLIITASNAAGADVLAVDVTVDPLPANAVGSFNGLVERDAALTTGYGGSINIVTSPAGTLTGKLKLGASSYRFIGQLDATANGVTTPARVTIVRALPLPNLSLALTFHHDTVGDAANVGKVDGTVIDVSLPGSPVNCLAWRSAVPSTFAAVYTAALELDPVLAGTADPHEGNIVYPQGNGYGTLTVTTAGVATWSGRMADGVVTTASVTMGPNGEVPLHFMLYSNTGSAHGWVQASGTDPNLLLDSLGTFDWIKSIQTAATLNYKNGFPLHKLTVIGAKYIKPTVANPLVLGIPSGLSGTNAKLLFSEGGLAALTYGRPPAVNLAAAAKIADLTDHGAFRIAGTATANSVSLPNPNPATFALSISATTGAFSGSFILHGDQDPTKPTQPTPSLINRTATFSGVCITRSTGSAALTGGVGYFLLPELQPYPGLSVTASPLLSGQVLLQQGP